MNKYTPDKWVLLDITSANYPPITRILAGWSGGYLDGDEWRASSGITHITEYDDRYEVDNYSGSRYICYKNSYGMTAYMSTVYAGWEKQMNDDMNVTIVPTENVNDFIKHKYISITQEKN